MKAVDQTGTGSNEVGPKKDEATLFLTWVEQLEPLYLHSDPSLV